MARLIVVAGAPDGTDRTVELGSESVTVGRDAANGIALDKEGKASRRHCQVVKVADGAYEVSDLRSTNGTRVNGGPIERRRLRHGDVIEVGLTKIRFEDPAQAAADAASGDACYLEWTAGERKGSRVPLTAVRTTFGRRETNTVPLEDKMASGHHAEVTKDLNGYTVRDLGSTNGTLVNGEPVTETLLKHGDRIRIGNARLAFKDPAMKDLVVDEAPDDDAESWGMMADVDAARPRGGAKGLVAALALLALLGGGLWYATTQVATGDAATRLAEDNQVEDGTFDSPDVISWVADAGAPVAIERATTGGAPKRGPHLVARRTDPASAAATADAAPTTVAVRYADDLTTVEGASYRVAARVRRDGDADARLAVEWSRLGSARSGSTAVTRTTPVGAATAPGAWTSVETVVRRPSWAQSGRLVLLLDPGAALRVDDVVFTDASAPLPAAPPLSAGRDVSVDATAPGSLDLVRTATVLAVGASPWARMPGGRVLGGPGAFVVDSAASAVEGGFETKGRLVDASGAVPTTVRWTSATDGLVATITAEGAEAVALAADVPISHLSEQLKVRSTAGSKVVEPIAGVAIDGVTRVLLGDAERREELGRPPTLLALDAGADAQATRLTTSRPDDPGLLRIALWRTGSSGEVRLVTSFDGERQRAREALREAKTLVDASPGPGIRRLFEVADTYPFEAQIRTEALALARAREERARADAQELRNALDQLDVYRDAASLDDVARKADALDAQFPPEPGAEGVRADVRARVEEARDVRTRRRVEAAVPQVRRLVRLGELLEQEPGFEVIAAIYYDTVVSRYGELESVGDAAGAGAAELGRQIRTSRERKDALLAKPEVRAAFPNLPK